MSRRLARLGAVSPARNCCTSESSRAISPQGGRDGRSKSLGRLDAPRLSAAGRAGTVCRLQGSSEAVCRKGRRCLPTRASACRTSLVSRSRGQADANFRRSREVATRAGSCICFIVWRTSGLTTVRRRRPREAGSRSRTAAGYLGRATSSPATNRDFIQLAVAATILLFSEKSIKVRRSPNIIWASTFLIG